MTKLNVKVNPTTAALKKGHVTHEGGAAASLTTEQQLSRAIMATMLWEDTFYESGKEIGQRIVDLAKATDPKFANNLAIEARSAGNLRHAPLLLTAALAKAGRLDPTTAIATIQRADEMGELLAMYWKINGSEGRGTRGKRVPIANSLRNGIRAAFNKFDAYQLSKYDRDAAVSLKDVVELTHPKPRSDEQSAMIKKLLDGSLETADTWETNLSAGKDKKETFERLIRENRLGYMALLRNLRNMIEAGVNQTFIEDALIRGAPKSRALPFRFVTAARIVPQLEPALERAMEIAMENETRLPGWTVILVDVSGSMDDRVSAKSQVTRMEAAATLGMLAAQVCERVDMFTFSSLLKRVPVRKGFGQIDAIKKSQPHSGTYLAGALAALKGTPTAPQHMLGVTYSGRAAPLNDTANITGADRIIIITDEQAHDNVGTPPVPRGYIVNVASNKNGVGYGNWNRVDGFSEAVIRWITETEKEGLL